jgi:type I restriction enzyme S subunit
VKDRVNTLMQPNLSINDLRAMPIPLPPASERENIIEKLLAIEAETQNLEAIYQRKLEALDELKRSLLHQAFSGEL